MIIIEGKNRSAKVMVPNESDLEQYARAQIELLCNLEVNIGNDIIIMPDVHPGKIGPIGLTIDISGNDTVIMPGLIGPDIGCGVTTVPIRNIVNKGDFQKLDTVIREKIPSGSAKNNAKIYRGQWWYFKELADDLGKFNSINVTKEELYENLGTLGGGNHFIELDKDEGGQVYLTVHSGSRNIGNKVYESFMRSAQKKLKELEKNVPYELTYIYGASKLLYLGDVVRCTRFAKYNRETIINTIAKEMNWKLDKNKIISKSHNDISNGILRKGSIFAFKETPVIIPINSKDGIIIGKGKSNLRWNCCAPHGSGRVIKRSEVSNYHSVSEYKKIMEENSIYSPSINKNTLDEAPFAYRDLEYLESANIEETIKIEKILKPIYNFKGGSK